MNTIKQNTFFLILIGILTLLACGPSESEIRQAKYEKEKQINELKFYYPKSYDNWWRTYQPKLKGAKGWITDNCENSKYKGKKGKVIKQSLSHKSWGSYEGSISLILNDNQEIVIVDFKCFKPDFSIGEWLSKKY